MLISNPPGLGRPGPSGAWARWRRGYAFAAVLVVALSAGAVPVAAAEAVRAAPGRDGEARAATVLVPGPPGAFGPGSGEAIGPLGARYRGEREPLAPGRSRTLVLAVAGGAAGLGVFAVGGFVTAARGRGGYGRRPHGSHRLTRHVGRARDSGRPIRLKR
ncbi:hypothetical protein [Streptomyces sp. NPDC088131]|uniref:hypothetical protein n=1 Tax=Streptomyces sp. NPDC088131 TaxID=3365826 RepID=UPI003825AFE9